MYAAAGRAEVNPCLDPTTTHHGSITASPNSQAIDPGSDAQSPEVGPASGLGSRSHRAQITRGMTAAELKSSLQTRRPLPDPKVPSTGVMPSWAQHAWNALPDMPQITFQATILRGERDAVPAHHARPNAIRPLGRRETLPALNISNTSKLWNLIVSGGRRAPIELMTSATPADLRQAAIVLGGRRSFNERDLLSLKAEVKRAFSGLALTPRGNAGVELVAVALTVMGGAAPASVADLARAVADIDFSLMRQGKPQDGEVPSATRRCIGLLMTLAQSGGAGADVAAALVAEKVPNQPCDATALALMAGSRADMEQAHSVLVAEVTAHVDDAAMTRLKADVRSAFPGLSSTRWGDASIDLVAVALAAADVGQAHTVADVADALNGLDFSALREQTPTDPLASRAVRMLMLLTRAGPPGVDIAVCLMQMKQGAQAPSAQDLRVLAEGPVDIEHRPQGFAALQRALQGHLAKELPVAHRLTEAQEQIVTLAILQACGSDAAQAAEVARRLVNHDFHSTLMAERDASAGDIAAQQALSHLVLSGGAAVLAALKLLKPGTVPMTVADLRIACLAAKALNPDGTLSLQQVLREAQRVHDTINSSAGAQPSGAEMQAIPPRRDVDAETGQGGPDEMDSQWPSKAELTRRRVPAADVDKRLTAFALVAVQRKLAGQPLTAAHRAASGAVRNHILSESGPLEFAENQTAKLGTWLKPSADAGRISRWITGNRMATDPLQPLVDNGPMGSLNNIAVPQLGMEETLKPLERLMMLLLVERDEADPSDQQLVSDYGQLALLQHWNGMKQAMLGTEVELLPEQLSDIGNAAASLAGRPGDKAFSAAVQVRLGGTRLDQGTLRGLYDDVVRRTLALGLLATDSKLPDIVEPLLEMDNAMLRATLSPADYDTYYRDDPSLPEFGRGAMKPGLSGARSRDRDRTGALAEEMRQFGTSSGTNMSSYSGFALPDLLTLVTLALRLSRVPGFGGRVGLNLVGPYLYSRIREAVVRMGVNASGIEFNFGEGVTQSGTWTLGAGPAIGLFELLGQWQRLNLIFEGSFGGTRAVYRSVFLRVPRTSEEEGGVPEAKAGSSSDNLRTEAMAQVIEEAGRLLDNGKSDVLLRLLAKFPWLSLGIADGGQDFNDTVSGERGGKFSPSQGVASVWRLPFSVGGSIAGSYVPQRALRIRTHGSIDATRTQDFTQSRFQVSAGAQLAGRASPAVLAGSVLPHRLNFPTSWTFMKTEIDGVIHRGGTYWSYETESLAEMLQHFREHALSYARGMLQSRPDLETVRDQKLRDFSGSGAAPADVAQMSKTLLDDDVQRQVEVLYGMILDRPYVPGLSYRGTGEISEEAHQRANELLAVRELASLSPQTVELAGAKDRALRHLLAQPSAAYVHNDVGFRTNTYKKDDAGLGGYLFSGHKGDARTSTARAKTT